MNISPAQVGDINLVEVITQWREENLLTLPFVMLEIARMAEPLRSEVEGFHKVREHEYIS